MSRLKYKVTVGTSSNTYWTTDVSDDFIQGEPRNAMGQVPTAIINLSNKDGKYTSASAIQENYGCVISASKDGGANYVRLFKGEIWKKNSVLTSDGVSTLELNCRDSRLLDKWISCNNAVQKGRDMGAVFTGSSTASDGSYWNETSVLEDFTTYTEVDPNIHIETTSYHIDFQAYRNEDAYIYKDKGAGSITDFTHNINCKMLSTNASVSSYNYFWVVSNDTDDIKGLQDASKNYISLRIARTGGPGVRRIYMEECNSGTLYVDYYDISADTWYYNTIKKNGTDLECIIYSDATKITPLDTLSLTLQSNYNFRYIFGCNTFNDGQINRLDSDIESLSIRGGGIDDKGNYPDGLLYETKLALSGNITDIYVGEDDVVIPIVHRHETIHDATKQYNEIYGLKSFIDPADDYYHLLSATVDFPTTSFILSYGKDINSSNLSWDGRDKDHGVIVYGSPPFFYKTGSSPYTYLYDANITSLEIAKEKAKNWYNIHTQSKGIAQGSITVPAITNSLIGYKIVVEDDARGWSGYGNVVGMNHTLRGDRWTTEVLFENIPPDNAKTMAEVLEEIEKREDEPTYMGVYDCFYPFDTSSTGLVSNSTTYASISAIGFGTSSANPTSATPQGLVDLRQWRDSVDDWYYFILNSNWGNEKYNNTGSSTLIKEFCIFKNDNDRGHPYRATISSTMSRPANTFDDTDFDVDLATYTFAPEQGGIFSIEADGRTFRLKDGSNKMKIGWAPTSSSPPDGKVYNGVLCPIIEPGTYWTVSTQYDPISSSYHKDLSWDCYSKSEGYYSFTRTISSENEDVVLQMTFETGLSTEQVADIDKIRVNAVARADYYAVGGEHTASNFVGLWNYTDEKYYGGFHSGLTLGEWEYISCQMTTSELISKLIDEKGICHVGIIPLHILSASTMSLEVAYVELFVERGAPNFIIEKGKILPGDSMKTYLHVTHDIDYFEGIYTMSDASGNELCSLPVITGRYGIFGHVPPDYPKRYGAPVFQHLVESPALFRGKWDMARVYSTELGGYGAMSWISFLTNRGLADTTPIYVKYMPKTNTLGTQFYSGNFNFSRSSNGSAKDKLIWQIKTSTDERGAQNFPAYGLPYTIKFNHLGKDDSVGNPATTQGDCKYRLIPSIGLNKTREKTLTTAFKE